MFLPNLDPRQRLIRFSAGLIFLNMAIVFFYLDMPWLLVGPTAVLALFCLVESWLAWCPFCRAAKRKTSDQS